MDDKRVSLPVPRLQVQGQAAGGGFRGKRGPGLQCLTSHCRKEGGSPGLSPEGMNLMTTTEPPGPRRSQQRSSHRQSTATPPAGKHVQHQCPHAHPGETAPSQESPVPGGTPLVTFDPGTHAELTKCLLCVVFNLRGLCVPSTLQGCRDSPLHSVSLQEKFTAEQARWCRGDSAPRLHGSTRRPLLAAVARVTCPPSSAGLCSQLSPSLRWDVG